MKKMKKSVKGLLIAVILVVLLFTGFYIYTLDYYKADNADIETAKASTTVSMIIDEKLTFFYPEKNNDLSTAFIFYPGGKVEHTAYTPLLIKLAEKGITGILVKMPFNLAVFQMNAAEKIFEKLPEINHWYIGGHSLGGAMASSYASKNSERVNGLILLAAYPTDEIPKPILAVYGSEDSILDITKLQNVKNQYMIEGGNHAYFGNYGEQSGDGMATITRAEQQEEAVKVITEFIKSNQ